MTLGPRIGRKKDSTHDAIVQALRQAGALVVDTSSMGGGVPDLHVAVGARYIWVECKAAREPLTPRQAVFAKEHPVKVLRSVDEAIQMVQMMKGAR